MIRNKTWARKISLAAALATMGTFATAGIAAADNLQDTIVDTVTGVTLVAGSTTPGTASIRVVGNNSAQDPDDGCNFDSATEKISLTFNTPQGVAATPQPLFIGSCGTDYEVSFTAASNAVSGTVTAVIASNNTGGTFQNQVAIPITVTNPNTKPSVAVTGVADGAEYVIGTVPTAMCEVTDAQQPNEPSFAAALSGTLVNGLGNQTATCDFTDNGGLEADTAAVTYTIVPPPNTKPTVEVTGVTDGAGYEIGDVPTAGCAVTDAEDGNSTVTPAITGTLVHGLGSQTVTCNATDSGGLAADTATATYTVVDTGDPTISHTVSGTKNVNGWYKTDVTVTFSCADEDGSGIDTCYADGETTNTKTLGEGRNQSVSGTATDYAGNTGTDTASGINIDKTKPTLQVTAGPVGGAEYYFESVPAAPSCAASDTLSGVAGVCEVSGYHATVGTHTVTLSATDLAGNTEVQTRTYTVKAWTVKGFYAPVDGNGVFNTVKGGSTVPLKFEVFAGTREIDLTSAIKSFTASPVTCDSAAGTDDVEILSTGGTSLRYDSTGGQFIQNWKTPTTAGKCYRALMSTQDGSTAVALFKIK